MLKWRVLTLMSVLIHWLPGVCVEENSQKAQQEILKRLMSSSINLSDMEVGGQREACEPCMCHPA